MHSVLAAPGTLVEGETVPLEEEERHHLRVRRAIEGEAVRVLDGAGSIAEGRLVRDPAGFAAVLDSVRTVLRPPGFTLFVGAGDKERFGWLAEKAAELGVTDLVPLKTERTRSVAAGIREGHVQALQRRARQAIKQSLSAWAPTVSAPCDVRTAAARGAGELRWIADPSGDPPPEIPPAAAVTIVVGPEGGFGPAERAIFLEAGFHRVRFAPDLLRFETAALAAAAVIASQRPRRPRD